MDFQKFLKTYPRLYHMAEKGSWEGIKKIGLLSTTALLNRYEVVGYQRTNIESKHRPESTTISHPEYGSAVVRDQKPMDDSGLDRALSGNEMTPSDWYQCLNSKVFFWVSKQRLHRLLNARAYRNMEHDVLTIDTRLLMLKYQGSTVLCPINSGCTKPDPAPRGPDTFLSIADYPWDYWHNTKRRPIWDSVVEVCVDRGVPDIQDYVLSVYRMKGIKPIHAIVPASSGPYGSV